MLFCSTPSGDCSWSEGLRLLIKPSIEQHFRALDIRSQGSSHQCVNSLRGECFLNHVNVWLRDCWPLTWNEGAGFNCA